MSDAADGSMPAVRYHGPGERFRLERRAEGLDAVREGDAVGRVVLEP